MGTLVVAALRDGEEGGAAESSRGGGWGAAASPGTPDPQLPAQRLASLKKTRSDATRLPRSFGCSKSEGQGEPMRGFGRGAGGGGI